MAASRWQTVLGAATLVLLSSEGASRGDPATAPREPAWVWSDATASPSPVDLATLSDREADLQRTCGRAEAGLRAVASRLVARKLAGLAYLDADALSQLQRVAGEPHVWPRAWIVSGRALDHEATRQRLSAWGGTFREPGERRCGVAIGFGPDGTEVIAVLAVDAAADLASLPVRTHVGAWLPVDAKLAVPATGARVVVMGPTGRPRTVPTRVDGDHVRAQVALDQPGAFTLQVVVDLATGPRPVLEAQLFADVAPWTELPDLRAPGESAAPPEAPDGVALTAMVETLRALEQLPLLARDPKLDALAQAHALRMQAARTVGHDLGDGDPMRRIEAAGVACRESGENVAHAESTPLAHRALYASPSHRANLLARGFDRIGVGVVRDADGSVWVTEEFAGGRP
jgi:uncharacterized protein YkwD